MRAGTRRRLICLISWAGAARVLATKAKAHDEKGARRGYRGRFVSEQD
jgi:hypothetical protein